MRFVFTWLPCWSKKHHYSGVYRGSKFMHFDKSCAKMSQNHTSNLDKVFLNVPPSSDFGLEARILQIGWFYRPKWKKVEKSASKNKHPIKLRFLIWRLQSANPEKKVIPENQGFGSCPLGKIFPTNFGWGKISPDFRWAKFFPIPFLREKKFQRSIITSQSMPKSLKNCYTSYEIASERPCGAE